MEPINVTSKEIEVRARTLGALPAAIFKWRKRGVPPKWQLKLLAAYDDIKPSDFSTEAPSLPPSVPGKRKTIESQIGALPADDDPLYHGFRAELRT